MNRKNADMSSTCMEKELEFGGDNRLFHFFYNAWWTYIGSPIVAGYTVTSGRETWTKKGRIK
ncbi:Uncharacterised protein [uncultured archaeon]|nr:Uncharacterised protein [uncultured archaeon]